MNGKNKVTPAALGALMNGDFENFYVAATPGGIEAQEAAGQRAACGVERLPIKGTGNRDEWERLGFKFGEPADDIFINVTFPTGWKLTPTDHSMWNKLKDEKGRTRAKMFYKAAFYDRSAHIGFSPRYAVSAYEYVDPRGETMRVVALDGDATLREFGTWKRGEYDKQDRLRKEAEEWMNATYPQWRDCHAYWSLPSAEAAPVAAPASGEEAERAAWDRDNCGDRFND